MSRRPPRPSPTVAVLGVGARQYIARWGRGSAVHLSQALELISVQINCFSCILVTGISLYLSDVLGGRRGDVCVSVLDTFSCSEEETRPVCVRGQEDSRVSLRVFSFRSYTVQLIKKLHSWLCHFHLFIFSLLRTHTRRVSILQGKLSTRCSISYQLSLEISTWRAHAHTPKPAHGASLNRKSRRACLIWTCSCVRASGTFVHEVNLDMRPCQAR